MSLVPSHPLSHHFHRMIRYTCLVLLSMVSVARASADEPKELQAAKSQYAQIQHPTEADRTHYLTALARLRDQLAGRGANAGWQAVDAELRSHPLPKDSDAGALSKLLTGKWSSPRHDYLFRKDGTWTMLPAEADTTHGRWRIQGNRYFSSAEGDASKLDPYTILLLTSRDFIFTDGESVFYEKRK
jgi:hypothetical protein